ncbi:hypothetical protein ES332_D05G101800v1 [Gossypium tomentosum]|uniref:Uncharacterized protein n=1 Tax=Gossypium tomentosum TaxID=34277 RepID=A0A5D2KTW8_GOSTO|nr:hypothetical protein ES332_D05G101800v1 [Gossypium tomentosum]
MEQQVAYFRVTYWLSKDKIVKLSIFLYSPKVFSVICSQSPCFDPVLAKILDLGIFSECFHKILSSYKWTYQIPFIFLYIPSSRLLLVLQ